MRMVTTLWHSHPWHVVAADVLPVQYPLLQRKGMKSDVFDVLPAAAAASAVKKSWIQMVLIVVARAAAVKCKTQQGY